MKTKTCREQFEQFCDDMGLTQYEHYYDCGSRTRVIYPEKMYELFKAGWNLRGDTDRSICTFPGMVQDQEEYYGNLMAEAIGKIDAN